MTNPGTIETYQSSAEEYYKKNADRSVIEDAVEEFLTRVEDATELGEMRILDVGCGPGWESGKFSASGCETLGIDLTPAFLHTARKEAPDASFTQMDMRSLGLSVDSFDGLWSCAAFLHVPREDAIQTLEGFHRVLRDGGIAHVSVKRGDGTRAGDNYSNDQRQFTLYQPDELRRKATKSGFSVLSVDAGSDEDDWIQLLLQA